MAAELGSKFVRLFETHLISPDIQAAHSISSSV